MKFAPKKTTHSSTSATPDPTTPDSVSESATPTDAASRPESSDPKGSSTATAESTVSDAPSRRTAPSLRRTPKWVIVTAGLVSAFTAGFIVNDQSSTTTEQVLADDAVLAEGVPTPVLSAAELVSAALDAAVEFHSTRQTYVGFTTDSVMVATSPSTILLASSKDGVCAYSKIVDGVRYEIGSDPTGETCTASTIEAAQVMLDDLTTSTEQSGAVALGASIQAVSEAAALFASLSFDAYGRPSLYGLHDLKVPGTKVLNVARDGQSATVQVIADGTCVYVVATATPSGTPAVSSC